MDENETTQLNSEKEKYIETDVFAWANNLLPIKEDLVIDLFLVAKSYIPVKVKVTKAIRSQLEPLFIDGILDYLYEGAEKGLVVRGFEEAEAEVGVLQRTQTFKVPNARETLRWINTQEHELETFTEGEHDFRNIKGVIARLKHPDLKQTVYVAKALPKSNVMQGAAGWMLRDGSFMPFDAAAALRVPTDNQLLILDQDMYVFSQARLKQLFSYDAKEAVIAEKKVQEINDNYKLSFPEGMSLQNMVEGKRGVIKKLQKLEVGSIKQEQVLEYAENMGVELLEDDAGNIIIMDDKDMSRFVNILNDDYMESPLTGERYEIIKKRPLKAGGDEQQAA